MLKSIGTDFSPFENLEMKLALAETYKPHLF